MRINDVKLAVLIVDRDIEQGAVIKVIAIVEVRGVVRKLTGPKAWMRHRRDQTAIRGKKPGDVRQYVQAGLAAGKTNPKSLKSYDIKNFGQKFLYFLGHPDFF